jgi:hypothetical protein
MNRDKTTHVVGAGNREQGKPHTDWFAWSLQLTLGLLVGSGVGYSVARLLFRSGFIGFDQMLSVIGGAALCCGAFASFHGDRAWMARSIFACPEPRRTQKARTCSTVVGSLGAVLVLVPVALHLITRDQSRAEASSHGFSIVLLVLAAIPGFLLIHALRTGTGYWRFGTLDREETPLFFWIYVLVNAVAVMCLLFGR